MYGWMIAFGLLTLLSGIGVVASQKPLHSALSLVATLFLVAVHFALLGADFLAVLQILIYAGAIMVLVVFVIMLLGLEKTEARGGRVPGYIAAVTCSALAAVVIYAARQSVGIAAGAADGIPEAAPRDVGRLLLTEYAFPFEISALLLFAAIVGAVILAYEPKRPLLAGRGLKAMRTGEESQESSALSSQAVTGRAAGSR